MSVTTDNDWHLRPTKSSADKMDPHKTGMRLILILVTALEQTNTLFSTHHTTRIVWDLTLETPPPGDTWYYFFGVSKNITRGGF